MLFVLLHRYAHHNPFIRLPLCALPFIFPAVLPPSVHFLCSFWHFMVVMSPRLSEYKHWMSHNRYINTDKSFDYAGTSVGVSSCCWHTAHGSSLKWAPIIETQWNWGWMASCEAVKSIKSQMLIDAFGCKFNWVFKFCLSGELLVSILDTCRSLKRCLFSAHMPGLSACMELRTGGGQTQASILNCSFGEIMDSQESALCLDKASLDHVFCNRKVE